MTSSSYAEPILQLIVVARYRTYAHLAAHWLQADAKVVPGQLLPAVILAHQIWTMMKGI